jgi:hypothetical protein
MVWGLCSCGGKADTAVSDDSGSELEDYAVEEIEEQNEISDLSYMRNETTHISDGNFDFTPSEFYEIFSGTEPDGFELSGELRDPLFIQNMMIYPIRYANSASGGDGENQNTGACIGFSGVGPDEDVSNICLYATTTAGISGDEYATLLSWFIECVLPEIDEDGRNDLVEKFTDNYVNDRDSTSMRVSDYYAVSMQRKENDVLTYHFVFVAAR